MPYARINDVDIYYEDHGSGEPVVLLNGIFMNTKSWYLQLKPLVSRGYRVILHDMRGQWSSGKPDCADCYSLEIHADDLKQLLDQLDVKKAHVVGTSYGGEVGMYFAVKYPEYVNDLTLIASVSEVHEELRITALRWLEGALSNDPKKFVLSWINDVYSDSFIEKSGPQLFERLVSVYSSGFDFRSATYLLKAFLKLVEEPLTPKLRSITKPTLVIAAEKDRVKPAKYSEIIARNIANSAYMIINDAGHAVVIEKPVIINYLLIGFLYSHPLTTT